MQPDNPPLPVPLPADDSAFFSDSSSSSSADEPWISRIEIERIMGCNLKRSFGVLGEGTKDLAAYGLMVEDYAENDWGTFVEFFQGIDPAVGKVLRIIRDGGWPTMEELDACPEVDPEKREGGAYVHLVYKLVDGVWEQWVYVGAGGGGAPTYAYKDAKTIKETGIFCRKSKHYDHARDAADSRPGGPKHKPGEKPPSVALHYREMFPATDYKNQIYIDRWLPISYPESFLRNFKGMSENSGLDYKVQTLRAHALARIIEATVGTYFGHDQDLRLYSTLIPPVQAKEKSYHMANSDAYFNGSQATYELTEEEKALHEEVYLLHLQELANHPHVPPPNQDRQRKFLLPCAYLSYQQQRSLPPLTRLSHRIPVLSTERDRILHGYLDELRQTMQYPQTGPEGKEYERVAMELFERDVGVLGGFENGVLRIEVGELVVDVPVRERMNSLWKGVGSTQIPETQEEGRMHFRVGSIDKKGKIGKLDFSARITFDELREFEILLTAFSAAKWDDPGAADTFQHVLTFAQELLDRARVVYGGELPMMPEWSEEEEMEVEESEEERWMREGREALAKSVARRKAEGLRLGEGDVFVVGDGQRAGPIPPVLDPLLAHCLSAVNDLVYPWIGYYQQPWDQRMAWATRVPGVNLDRCVDLGWMEQGQAQLVVAKSERRGFFVFPIGGKEIGKEACFGVERALEKPEAVLAVLRILHQHSQGGATYNRPTPISEFVSVVPRLIHRDSIGRTDKLCLFAGQSKPYKETNGLALVFEKPKGLKGIREWIVKYALPGTVKAFLGPYLEDTSLDRALIDAEKGDRKVYDCLKYWVEKSRALGEGF